MRQNTKSWYFGAILKHPNSGGCRRQVPVFCSHAPDGKRPVRWSVQVGSNLWQGSKPCHEILNPRQILEAARHQKPVLVQGLPGKKVNPSGRAACTPLSTTLCQKDLQKSKSWGKSSSKAGEQVGREPGV